MHAMFVRQPVADYEQWEKVFAPMAPAREKFGLTVSGIYRLTKGPETIFIILEFSDMERAKEFVRSAVLSEGREKALAGDRQPADVWFSDDKIKVK